MGWLDDKLKEDTIMYPPSNDMADVSALAAGGSCEHRATDRSLRSAQVERDVEDGSITITTSSVN